MREFELACISDEVYLKYLKTLLISLKKICLLPKVHIVIINCKNEASTKATLLSIYKHLDIEFIYKDFESKALMRAYCANYRTELINKLLEKGIQNICYIDVDSLFVNRINIEDLFGGKYDIKIHLRNSFEKRFQVAAGLIVIKNTPASKKFIGSWAKLISHRQHEWFADQITFVETMNLLKNIDIKPLSKRYIDWNFESNSMIWAGKGKRKKENLKFVFKRLYLKAWNLIN